MKTSKIRLNVEIVPYTESPTDEPLERDDGRIEISMAESEAIPIDPCERAQLIFPLFWGEVRKWVL